MKVRVKPILLFHIQVGYWLGGGPAAGLCSAWTPATGLLTYVGDEVTSLPCNQTSALAGDISMQVGHGIVMK